MKKEMIPQSILERVENEMLSGEELLWVGLPGRDPLLVSVAFKMTMAVILIMLGLFAGLFLMAERATSGSGWGIIGGFIPLIMILLSGGIVMAAADQKDQSPELYAISTRRAMIFTRDAVQSFGPQDLQFIERQTYRDGSGDIIFKREYATRTALIGTIPSKTTTCCTLGFLRIENPVEVEALMLETFRAQSTNHLESHVYYVDETGSDRVWEKARQN